MVAPEWGGEKISSEFWFFPERAINTIEDYQPFFYSRTYIRQKAPQFPGFREDWQKIKRLARIIGYKNVNRFLDHKKQWDKFERKIPRIYLKKIGVKEEVLKFTAELDYRDYEKALKVRRLPETASVRYMPAVYGRLDFPPGTDEKQAIEILKNFSARKKLRCFINYSDLLIIFVEPEGEVKTRYFPPEIRFSPKFCIPENREVINIGKSRLN